MDKQFGVIKLSSGKVCEKHTECYRQQKQRLEFLCYCKVHKNRYYNVHDKRLYKADIEYCGACGCVYRVQHLIDTRGFPQV